MKSNKAQKLQAREAKNNNSERKDKSISHDKL